MIIKNEAEKLATQKKHLQEKLQEQDLQAKKIRETISELEKNIDTQATFACEKINTNCPFIKIINKKTFDQLDQQKKTFQDQENQILATIQKLSIDIQTLTNTVPQQETNKIQTLESQQQTIEKNIETIKLLLNEINYKAIEVTYNDHIQQNKLLKDLDQKITQLELESKQIEERKLNHQKAIIQKENISKQKEEYLQLIAQKQEQYITKE